MRARRLYNRAGYPFEVRFNPANRLFEVFIDGELVGAHRGRGKADRIGIAACAERAREPPTKVTAVHDPDASTKWST